MRRCQRFAEPLLRPFSGPSSAAGRAAPPADPATGSSATTQQRATDIVPTAESDPVATEASPIDASPSSPPALPFAARSELPTRGKPVGLLLHDFDRDGKDELVAATFDPGTLVYWNDPLAPPLEVPVPDYPLGPELVRLPEGDFAALASRSSNEIVLFDLLSEDPAKPFHRITLRSRPRAFGVGFLRDLREPSLVVATEGRELEVFDREGHLRAPLVEGLPTFVSVLPHVVVVGSQSGTSVRAYRLEAGELRPDERHLDLDGIPRAHRVVETSGGPEHWIVGGDRDLWRARTLGSKSTLTRTPGSGRAADPRADGRRARRPDAARLR